MSEGINNSVFDLLLAAATTILSSHPDQSSAAQFEEVAICGSQQSCVVASYGSDPDVPGTKVDAAQTVKVETPKGLTEDGSLPNVQDVTFQNFASRTRKKEAQNVDY